jgi:membrane protein implicated in regulation of membrane protease activity
MTIMNPRRLLDLAASVLVIGGLLFAFLPAGERWGPIAFAVPLTVAFWYLGERYREHRQQTRSRPPE